MTDGDPRPDSTGDRSFLPQYLVIGAMLLTIVSQSFQMTDGDGGRLNVILLLGCACVLLIGVAQVVRGKRAERDRQ